MLQALYSFDHLTTANLQQLPGVVAVQGNCSHLATGGRDNGPCLLMQGDPINSTLGFAIGIIPNIDVTIGMWIAATTSITSTARSIISFCNPSTTDAENSNLSHVNITLEPDGSLRVFRKYPGTPFTTLLGATNPGVVTFGSSPIVPVYIEVRVLIADSGTVTIRANGVQVLALTAVDTQHGGNPLVTYIALNGGSSQLRVDDVYVVTAQDNGDGWNGLMGIMKIDGKLANGAGDLTQWTPSVPTGVNWQNVDDSTPNLTDYNDATAVNLTDIYHIEDISFDPIAIQVDLLLQKLDAGPSSVVHTLKHEGVVYNSPDVIGVSPGFKYYKKGYTTAPDLTAWNMTKFNALQAGPKKVA
jgi:hypothetical protein